MDFTETADIETSSDDYASRFKGEIGEWFLDVQKKLVLSELVKGSVLDVGGGHGQLAGDFAAEGHETTVIGSSTECERRIRSLTEKGLVRFVVGNLVELPFPDKTFRNVVSVRFLSHCTDWRTLIKELCRVSSDRVIVDYPTWRSSNIFYGPLFMLKKSAEGNTRTYKTFWDSEIVSEFEKNGFSLQKRAPQFFLPMVIYRKLKNRSASSSFELLFSIFGATRFFGSPVIASFMRR